MIVIMTAITKPAMMVPGMLFKGFMMIYSVCMKNENDIRNSGICLANFRGKNNSAMEILQVMRRN